MSIIIEDELVLDQNETTAFIRNMIHPNTEALRRRDTFLDDIVIRVSGGEIVAEYDIPFESQEFNYERRSN